MLSMLKGYFVEQARSFSEISLSVTVDEIPEDLQDVALSLVNPPCVLLSHVSFHISRQTLH